MLLRSLHHRVEELEARLIGQSIVIRTLSGRKVRISDKDAVRLMMEAWDVTSHAGDLSRFEISDQLAAVGDCPESNPLWPEALTHAHFAITHGGKYVGRAAIMHYLRTKKEKN